MAIKRRRSTKRASAMPATRARSVARKRSAPRRRKAGTFSKKFDLINGLLMPAAGAGLAIVAGNAIAKMIPSVPYGKSLVPFGLAFVTGSMLKQPGLAAGMAAAGGINLLQSLSPTMFADEASEFINESPVPMMTFQDDYEEYQAALMNGQFNDENEDSIIKYDATGAPVMVSNDGQLTYL